MIRLIGIFRGDAALGAIGPSVVPLPTVPRNITTLIAFALELPAVSGVESDEGGVGGGLDNFNFPPPPPPLPHLPPLGEEMVEQDVESTGLNPVSLPLPPPPLSLPHLPPLGEERVKQSSSSSCFSSSSLSLLCGQSSVK